MKQIIPTEHELAECIYEILLKSDDPGDILGQSQTKFDINGDKAGFYIHYESEYVDIETETFRENARFEVTIKKVK